MEDYNETIDEIAKRYSERILSLLEKIRWCFQISSFDAERPLVNLCTDEYRWALDVLYPPFTELIGIYISIPEAVFYGDDEEDGISFRMDIVAEGGEILGVLAPFNYTDECWVDVRDEEAIEERFKLVECVDIYEIVGLAAVYYAGLKERD